MGLAGLPFPNKGDFKTKFLVLNGHTDGWEKAYQVECIKEILQGLGRPRANRPENADKQFTLYFWTPPESDLGWVKEWGIQLSITTAGVISPEAVGKSEGPMVDLLLAAAQLVADGVKLTQKAIADKTPGGKDRSVISKQLSGAGITLTFLQEKLEQMIESEKCARPLYNSYKGDAHSLREAVYRDFGWLLGLPPADVVAEVVTQIETGGKAGLMDYLALYPPAMQSRMLGLLTLTYFSEPGEPPPVTLPKDKPNAA